MLRFLTFLAFVLTAVPALGQSRAGKSDFYFSPTFVNGQNLTTEGGGTIQTDTGTGFELGWHYNFDPHSPFLAFNAGWTYVDTGIPSGLPQNSCWYYWYTYYCGTYQPTHATTKFSWGAGLGVRADIGRSFVLRGMVSQQYVDFAQYSSTPWTVWRIDLGARF